jgi:hypothetical protein
VGALTDRLALTTGPQRQAAHKEPDSPHQDPETERHADPMQDIRRREMPFLLNNLALCLSPPALSGHALCWVVRL